MANDFDKTCGDCGADEDGDVVYIGDGEFFCHVCGNVLDWSMTRVV